VISSLGDLGFCEFYSFLSISIDVIVSIGPWNNILDIYFHAEFLWVNIYFVKSIKKFLISLKIFSTDNL